MSYDRERKQLAVDDIRIMYDCADKAGIRHALFIGFGHLLGIVREGDFIGHDNDGDMCILADRITAEQLVRYYQYLAESGMFFARFGHSERLAADGAQYDLVAIQRAGNRGENVLDFEPDERIAPSWLTWFTLRPRAEHHKFCHWVMFPWNGYYWHTKAGKWLRKGKFDPALVYYDKTDAGLMLGTPAQYLNKLEEITFYDTKVNVPYMASSCLDVWYTNWFIPRRGGSSNKHTICRVKDWLDERTWTVSVVK
jgi:hypothetical protein